MENKYDAIVIGARCAGSPTAMLLARKGYKVLLVDKAKFPSDTISTHIIFPNGVKLLMNWGLLDKVRASNPPLISRMGADFGPFMLMGSPPLPEGVPGIFAPRRIILDKILVDAAVEAGVEFRENCMVEEILADGDQVTGIRCHSKGGTPVTEKARIVIGADGRNSVLAKKVHAESYNEIPVLTCWYYTYWSGTNIRDLVLHSRPNRAFGAIPTNDGLVCLPVACAASDFHEFRTDVEGNYLKTLEMYPELSELVRQGKREEKFYGMSDNDNFFRKPFGPGWALVGDAGYHKDPITGQGISDAFRDAESLTDALDAGFSGKDSLENSLALYQKTRDEKSMPMYGFTCDFAKLEDPPPDMQYFFSVLVGNQKESDRFFGALAGTVPIPEFYSQENIQRIIGAVNA